MPEKNITRIDKNKISSNAAEKKKSWPAECVWPEPVKEGEGYYWEAEDAESLPLDNTAQHLLDIREYMDQLVADERLLDDYTLNPDYEDWNEEFTPEKGDDYWDEDGFNMEAWSEDMVSNLNNLKLPLPSPVDEIQRIIGYEFINENILRQAFTRRAFTLEHGTGDSEVLEFYGDSALNMVITRELARQTSDVEVIYPCEPFTSEYDEGDLSRIRQHYVNKEYLSARASALGLDKYILYGTGEQPSESSREDMMEALIGAVAVDSGWDWYALEAVVDRLLTVQLSDTHSILKTSYYDLFNSWHQRKFGQMPEYEVSKGKPIKLGLTDYKYLCTLRYFVPENDKGIWTSQRVDVQRETRSMARERAAEEAYNFLVSNGLWMNLKDAGIKPDLENAINQLQELYQKKYVEQPAYRFDDYDQGWYCTCSTSGIKGWGRAKGKTRAKKKAAFMVLVKLMISAGLATEEMKSAMYKTQEN